MLQIFFTNHEGCGKKLFGFFFRFLFLYTFYFLADISATEAGDFIPQTQASVECDNPSQPEELRLNLQNGIQLALSAERRLGQALGGVTRADLNLELAVSEFDIQFIPQGDTGYIGGGRVGEGFTIGGGIEINKKFAYGTRISILPTIMKAAKDYQSNLRVLITQPLLRGFGKEYTLSGVYAAQFASRSARRSLYVTQVNLILQVIQGMLEIVKQEELTRLDRDALERMGKFCVSTRVKEKIGLCDALDVYRAETELKHAEDSFNQSQERLQDAKDNLRDTLALPLDVPLKIDVPIEYTPITLNVDEGIQIALTNRIEIDQARDQLQENQRRVRIEEKNLWPDLNFTADYSSFAYDEVFTSAWTDRRESKWGFGFTSVGTPSNGAYDQAALALRDAELNVDQVYDDVALDVKRILRLLQRAGEKITLQDEQIKNAQKGYHLARLKFEHGMASNFDLIQAEKGLRSAQNALIGAIIEHKINEFRLLSSLGTLADKPGLCK